MLVSTKSVTRRFTTDTVQDLMPRVYGMCFYETLCYYGWLTDVNIAAFAMPVRDPFLLWGETHLC